MTEYIDYNIARMSCGAEQDYYMRIKFRYEPETGDDRTEPRYPATVTLISGDIFRPWGLASNWIIGLDVLDMLTDRERQDAEQSCHDIMKSKFDDEYDAENDRKAEYYKSTWKARNGLKGTNR